MIKVTVRPYGGKDGASKVATHKIDADKMLVQGNEHGSSGVLVLVKGTTPPSFDTDKIVALFNDWESAVLLPSMETVEEVFGPTVAEQVDEFLADRTVGVRRGRPERSADAVGDGGDAGPADVDK